MNSRSLALVAVILSTLSGASLAAHTAGYTQAPSATENASVTGSTTLISLEGQLSGKPALPVPVFCTASLSGHSEANGIAISDH